MEAREKPWIKPENGIRIQFVGEAAIHDGALPVSFIQVSLLYF